MTTPERGRLDRVVTAADELIAAVRSIPSIGGTRGDTSGLVMHGAYGAGFRRFVAIRNLANDGSAEEAGVLTRSLLSIVVRAGWVDAPTDPAQRRDRFRRLLRRQYEDDLYEWETQKRAGFNVDETVIQQTRKNLDELLADGVKGVPQDRQLFETLNLGPVYARIYAPASNAMHFSIDAAVGDLINVDEVALERRDYPRSAEVIHLAVIVFGILLELSDKSVRHGLRTQALAVLERLMADLAEA